MRSTEDDKGKQALATALRILTRRDLSSAELTRRLILKGFSDENASETVSRLIEAGYLDDRRFARQWAESAIRNGRAFGPRLRLGLTRQLIPDEITAEVMESLSSEYDEMETLFALLSRKFAGFIPSTAGDREKRRVVQYLQRRGFSTYAIFRAFTDKTD